MVTELKQRAGFLQPNILVQGYTHTEALGNGETSQPVIIPPAPGQRNVTMSVEAGAGSGKIQYTLDTDKLIKSGGAYWIDWDKGAVTGTATDVAVGPVTGLRGVSVSGAITWRLCM